MKKRIKIKDYINQLKSFKECLNSFRNENLRFCYDTCEQKFKTILFTDLSNIETDVSVKSGRYEIYYTP